MQPKIGYAIMYDKFLICWLRPLYIRYKNRIRRYIIFMLLIIKKIFDVTEYYWIIMQAYREKSPIMIFKGIVIICKELSSCWPKPQMWGSCNSLAPLPWGRAAAPMILVPWHEGGPSWIVFCFKASMHDVFVYTA